MLDSGQPNFGPAAVPIGHPLENTTGFVLGQGGSHSLTGIEGELILGGPKVATRYVSSPGQTLAAFEYCSESGRVYKTGDRVRWTKTNGIEFMGRVDFQVKLNGQRIETGEIEQIMRQSPGVLGAAVVLLKSEAGIARLVGYVVPAEPNLPPQVRATCVSLLPSYMVPAAVVAISAWPLNSSGKVNRPNLPKSDNQVAECSQISNNHTLHVVLHTLEKLTGSRPHPRQPMMADGFLNSLSAVRFCRLLEQEFGEALPRLPATLVFNYPTPEAIVSCIELQIDKPAVAQIDSDEMPVIPFVQQSLCGDQSIFARASQSRAAGVCGSSHQLWAALASAPDVLHSFPVSRRAAGVTLIDLNDNTRVKHGYFVDCAEMFDCETMGMNKSEVVATDPEHRMLLESVLGVWTQIGQSKEALLGSATGVFVGCLSSGWLGPTQPSPYSLFGTMVSATAGRVAYLFGLTGPACVVDTGDHCCAVIQDWLHSL